MKAKDTATRPAKREPHPLITTNLPALSKGDIACQAERITMGERPVVELLDGKVVRGWLALHGYLATGLKPVIRTITKDDLNGVSLAEYIGLGHVPSVDLSQMDRAWIGILTYRDDAMAEGRKRMAEGGAVGGKHKTKGKGLPKTAKPYNWAEDAAKKFNSRVYLLNKGSWLLKHYPDVFEMVRRREIVILSDAIDLVHILPKSKEQRAMALRRFLARPRGGGGKRPPMKNIAYQVRREVGIERLDGEANGKLYEILTGDCAVVGKVLQDESFDGGYMDGTWGTGKLRVFEEGAKLYARVLRPGTLVVFDTGQEDVPEVWAVILKHLDFIGVATRTMPLSRVSSTRIEKIDSCPLLVCTTKGKRLERRLAATVFESSTTALAIAANAKRRTLVAIKKHHPWERDLAATKAIVEAIMPVKNGRVLDVTCGSGTTGVAAIELGHSFVGIEIASEHAKTARGRCEEAEKEFFARKLTEEVKKANAPKPKKPRSR